MTSQEDQDAIDLLPGKQKKVTDCHQCVVCQMDENESLRKARDASICKPLMLHGK